MTTPRRKIEIAKVRAEGREAALAGRSAGTNPYPNYNSDALQWHTGYLEGERELRAGQEEADDDILP